GSFRITILDFQRSSWHTEFQSLSWICTKAERSNQIVENEKFVELEKKVKDLIDAYQVLKKQNLDLEAALRRKEDELVESKGRFQEMMEEKEAVRQKVDSLLLLLQDVPS
ncbi:MAG TPA: hypothetical protein PL090_03330, partial [Syntrophales bacterium]|nr:hypothetical protein [Syntrophales bacterium]